ncbi:NAD(P)-dependent dehydrogenase, short-chain alcohol dehydrogenase family [Paracoccus halophilus]|uniref:NAD(P)-dependent dehydrogenase, short-chain alcohol dehydrogenase family n=1 Tax=Paracoccus halophilus TaxID=376733 RepID=A0A099F655_9RHOB|nr:SDR family oxidoreductase [Paracoccus halophilus]KGJ05572.1 short-chain dehydrogenase [Paracoccus halophilus]SFA47104.1 NAD(P)-dependent dehydrogenase, short-chain alcohol dehydrogenase family [Paracoccus halophilus]
MTALITGAGQRLGRAIALYLAGRGQDVAIHFHHSADGAEATAAEARAMGVRAEAFHADLLDLDQTETLIGRVAAVLGPLTLLVNNASIFEYDNLDSATRQSWDRHIGSNLRAPFLLTQAFARQAPKADHGTDEPRARALVINMIDQRVLKPTPEFMTYSIAKAGLWWLTRSAAQALAPDIRVNAIGPGPTLQGIRQSDEHFARQRAATILQRGAGPDDICAAVGYLIDAPSVTGQLICVDGGQHLAWRTPDVLGVE